MSEPTRKSVIQLSVRTAAAAAAAVAIGSTLHLGQPTQSVITAVLVTDLSPQETRRNAFSRVLGTVIGAGLGAALNFVLPRHPLVVGLGIVVAMLLAHFLRLRRSARVAGYVCGVVLLADRSADPWMYATSRLAETTLGLVMAVLVSHVPLLLKEEPPAEPSET